MAWVIKRDSDKRYRTETGNFTDSIEYAEIFKHEPDIDFTINGIHEYKQEIEIKEKGE